MPAGRVPGGARAGAAMTRFQTLATATVLATLVLIAIGAVVRTTGSGLGCPDWPLCHGRLVPPNERIAIIEYTHRTAAAIVGVLIVSTAAITLLRFRADGAMRNLAIASLPLLALQAWLGKETVERELPAEVVTFHLGMALVLLGTLTLLAAFAILGPERRRLHDRARRSYLMLTIASGLVVLVVLLAGSYVVGSNATTACTTWPGCSQAPIPFVDGIRETHIHWAHRLLVLVGFAAVALLAWRAEEIDDPGRLRTISRGLVVLYGAQILIGGANIWSEFSDAALVAHLAGGALIWAVLVVLAVATAYEPAAQPESRSARPRRPERGTVGA